MRLVSYIAASAVTLILIGGCAKPSEPTAGGDSQAVGSSANSGLKPTSTDDSIKAAVEKKIKESPDLKGEKVEVSVKDGRVTLTGTVSSQEKRILVEDLVRGVDDVFGVDGENLVAK